MRRAMAAAVMVCWGCNGEPSSGPHVPLDDFELDAAEETALGNAQVQGGTAGATYTYDEGAGVLELVFTQSDLDCEGLPQAGETITAEVVSLTATAMTLNITAEGASEGDLIEFTRVDSGAEGIVGVWKTQDGDNTIYLVVAADGSASLVTDESCSDERSRNQDGCLVLSRTGFSITVDGDDSDWNEVGPGAMIEDALGEQGVGGDGADMVRMRATTSGDRLYVLVEFGDTVAVPSGTSIRFQTRQSTGNATQQVGADIGRNPEDTDWILERTSGSSITTNFAVVGSIVEIELPLLESSVDVLRADLYRCSMIPGEPCVEIEAIDECAAFE